MENISSHVLHTHTASITIQHRGALIETFNKKGELIHIIDSKEVANKIAIHRWVGSVTNDEIKAIFDGHFYTYLQQGGLTKILIDTSKMNGFFDGVNSWLAEFYIPKLLKSGIKCNAFLLSKEFYEDLAEDGLDEAVHGPLASRMFGSEEQALQWLQYTN